MSFIRLEILFALDVGVGKQMLLAILIIAVALGAESKLQCVIILVCPTTYRTFMLCYPCIALNLMLKLCPALHLLG